MYRSEFQLHALSLVNVLVITEILCSWVLGFYNFLELYSCSYIYVLHVWNRCELMWWSFLNVNNVKIFNDLSVFCFWIVLKENETKFRILRGFKILFFPQDFYRQIWIFVYVYLCSLIQYGVGFSGEKLLFVSQNIVPNDLILEIKWIFIVLFKKKKHWYKYV